MCRAWRRRQVLVPKVALLDPLVTVSLPANITAATGMDALTHAVESHLSYWQHALTREHSLRAIGRIGKHLLASAPIAPPPPPPPSTAWW